MLSALSHSRWLKQVVTKHFNDKYMYVLLLKQHWALLNQNLGLIYGLFFLELGVTYGIFISTGLITCSIYDIIS